MEAQNNGGYLFCAKVDALGTVASLLKSVAFCEKVNLFVNPNGLKFTVEEGKYVQASVFMQKELFQEFLVQSMDLSFKIPLKELLECLKIFYNDGKITNDTTMEGSGSNVSLMLLYRRRGSPLDIVLEENTVQTDFQLKTEDIDDLMEFEINPMAFKVLMKSDLLFDILGEIDSNGPEFLEILITPDENMHFICKGISGKMEVLVPSTAELIEHFQCNSSVPCQAKYRFAILKYAFKALQIGQKVALKLNARGILCLSFILTTRTDSFIEFFCIPVIGDVDEDDDEA